MVAHVEWRSAYRIIPSVYPPRPVFEDVAQPGDLNAVLALESATNPRILTQAGELSLVRPDELLPGQSAAVIMAAFAHTKPSRFSDGSYGVYYAAADEPTAIAETAYHRLRFITDAGMRSEIVQMRVYAAHVRGTFDDVRARSARSAIYDPANYAAAQQYARRIFSANRLDGIVFRSVRRPAGECVAVFRPRCVSNPRVERHLQYRFEDGRFIGAMELGPLEGT
jgi:hypothetical protein